MALGNICDAHIFSLVQSFYTYGSSTGEQYPLSQPPPRRVAVEESEGSPSPTPCVQDEAAPVVLQDGWHRLQAMRELQKEVHVFWVKALLRVRCVTRHDGRSITETEALKLSNLGNRITSNVRCDSSFVATVKSVTNLSASFCTKNVVSFLAAGTLKIVEDAVFF